MTAVRAVLPSPTEGVWTIGPFPLRAYALCIILGIVVAVWLGDRRWRARGGRPGAVLDIAAWAVPFGIVGGRLYHVASSWQPYFGPDGNPWDALLIWRGGLGIWGAVALGGVGAWIGARRQGILLPPMADALAPGIVLAQAIGRWGNWFNNELYGSPTDRPWGLRIYEWDPDAGRAVTGPDGEPVVKGVFHPAFLYESLWNVGIAVVLILVERRYRLGHGRVFALYVLLYTIGRGWIEALRVDPANTVLGLRLNLWTSLLVGLGALAYLVVSARLRPGRETELRRPEARTPSEDAPDGTGADTPAAAAGERAGAPEGTPEGTPQGTAADGPGPTTLTDPPDPGVIKESTAAGDGDPNADPAADPAPERAGDPGGSRPRQDVPAREG